MGADQSRRLGASLRTLHPDGICLHFVFLIIVFLLS
jgi:hypothetical protein